MKDYYAAQYGNLEQWHWWFRGRRRIIEAVLRRELSKETALSIASVGCGPAEGLAWLTPIAGPNGRVVGLDADPLHAPRPASGLLFVVGKLEAAPLAPGSFDAILALDVLEHLDDDAAGLREAARLLKSGGLLLVTVPALPSLWGQQDVISHHRRRYTRRALCDAFARARLPRPCFMYFNTLLFAPIAAVRWVRRALGLAKRLHGDFDDNGPGLIRCDQAAAPDRRLHSDFEDNRPGLINDLLAAVFAIERHLIGRVPMPVGASLMAIGRSY
jgi:SAM-dependent methyltransferase